MYIYCTICIIYNIEWLYVIVHYYSMVCRHTTSPVKQMILVTALEPICLLPGLLAALLAG